MQPSTMSTRSVPRTISESEAGEVFSVILLADLLLLVDLSDVGRRSGHLPSRDLLLDPCYVCCISFASFGISLCRLWSVRFDNKQASPNLLRLSFSICV